MRPATRDDEAMLLAWRNDPVTRESAFSESEVSVDEHRRWYAGKLADPGCLIVIAEEEGRPVAQVRFDRIEPELAEVDITVDREARGRGIGGRSLYLAVAEAGPLLGITRVLARVKPENEASLRLFASAGFRVIDQTDAVVELMHIVGPDSVID